jgi:hypothetical protein
LKAFVQQVAAQTEQLLWLAYRLQLEELAQQLHGFIRSGCLFGNSLFRNGSEIFTARVLEAAGASGMDTACGPLFNSVLTQEVAFTGVADGERAVLQPILTAQRKQLLTFDAVVHGGVLGIANATKMHVSLDLFGKSRIQINDDVHLLQLRIGSRAS